MRIWQLSRDEQQHFPFAVVSINFTTIVLQVLREVNFISFSFHFILNLCLNLILILILIFVV